MTWRLFSRLRNLFRHVETIPRARLVSSWQLPQTTVRCSACERVAPDRCSNFAGCPQVIALRQRAANARAGIGCPNCGSLECVDYAPCHNRPRPVPTAIPGPGEKRRD